MSVQASKKNNQPEVDWAIFVPAVIIVLVCAIPLMLFPDSAAQLLVDGRKAIMSNFLWLYLSVAIAAVMFCLWLAFGPYAHVKLGSHDVYCGHWCWSNSLGLCRANLLPANTAHGH
jgi:choline-glycine betaine transporter